MFNMNGPPKGFNTVSDQSSYDLVFKDVIVKSENRNTIVYPNPNNYTVTLGEEVTKIYKAEIITANIPAATDISVNISSNASRLYFKYVDSSGIDNFGYVKLQAGTYYSPVAIAAELKIQFDNVIGSSVINVVYNTNLNRYMFIIITAGTSMVLYPDNGATCDSYTVQDSIGLSLHLYENDVSLNTTQPINIVNNANGLLDVIPSNIYGSYNGTNTTTDPTFGDTIVSDLVLTNCSIYLSIGTLNSNTIKFVSNNNPEVKSNISNIFCEIPTNTAVSSVSNKTLLNEPAVWSGINFYNPPLASLTKFDISWYNEYGELINNISDHCFTLRIYYFQKRNPTTAFSISAINYSTPSGSFDSIFSQSR